MMTPSWIFKQLQVRVLGLPRVCWQRWTRMLRCVTPCSGMCSHPWPVVGTPRGWWKTIWNIIAVVRVEFYDTLFVMMYQVLLFFIPCMPHWWWVRTLKTTVEDNFEGYEYSMQSIVFHSLHTEWNVSLINLKA